MAVPIYVKMSFSNVGGTIQGAYGTYVPGSDGTAEVDTRDVPVMLALGATFVASRGASYQTPVAPAAAATGQFIASAALSNGALSIANQPDVPRQAQVVIGAGTSALTAGAVSIQYRANDGTTQTDTVSAVVAASGVNTSFLTKGVCHILTAVVSGVAGGASPYIEVNTTTAISVPVDPGAVDFSVTKETINSGDETVGTVSTSTLGTITPTTAPNATHTYGFMYGYTAPTS